MTPAERAFAEARDQGLPERIEDPTVLGAVASLLAVDAQGEDEAAA